MRIDHIELFVPNRDAAAIWYGEWLGFRVMPEHADWAQGGPLMLTHDDGQTMLALFEGESVGTHPNRGWRRTAYRTDGDAFGAFFERYEASGQAITRPVDHKKAWSVYFTDPWGNPLEVTSYDYQKVKAALAE